MHLRRFTRVEGSCVRPRQGRRRLPLSCALALGVTTLGALVAPGPAADAGRAARPKLEPSTPSCSSPGLHGVPADLG